MFIWLNLFILSIERINNTMYFIYTIVFIMYFNILFICYIKK